jgi:hypothetical protein
MFRVDLTATIDELEQGFLAREQAISLMRQQQAEMLRALDVMQVDRVDGARSLQEWTRGRLDVSAHTARDLVDAARALPEQPNLVQNAEGLSFERLVATSRLVASGACEAVIRNSFGFDIAGVGRLRNRHRRISRRSERDVFVDRYVYLQDSFDGSRGRVKGELPGFEYRILARALEERADMFGDLPGPRVAKQQRLADALVSIAQDSLELPTPEGETSHRTDPVATVFVDAELADSSQGEAGAEIEFGPKVGPDVLDRILCTGRVQLVAISDGKPVATSDGPVPSHPRSAVSWHGGMGVAPSTAATAATGSNPTTSKPEPTVVITTPPTSPR